jgi:hypothetical protein
MIAIEIHPGTASSPYSALYVQLRERAKSDIARGAAIRGASVVIKRAGGHHRPFQ